MTLWGNKHKRIPEEWRELYLKQRSADEVRRDLVIAFDRMESMKLKLWILGGALLGEGAVIGWLATSLLNCLQAAHGIALLVR